MSLDSNRVALAEIIRDIFEDCNSYVSSRYSRIPTLTEPALDAFLVTHLIDKYSGHIFRAGNLQCKVEAGLTAGFKHWCGKEVGDILFSLRFTRGLNYQYGKLVFCQSKRLMKSKIQTVRGINEFFFDSTSKYESLNIQTSQPASQLTQFSNNQDFAKSNPISIHYLFYNPSHMPHKALVPNGGHFFRQPGSSSAGVQTVDMAQLASLAPQTAPTYGQIQTLTLTTLEDFAEALVLCSQGTQIADQNRFEELRNRFYERIGGIWEIALEIEMSNEV